MPISSQIYSECDIDITDNDGDGYFFWGLGQRPEDCPDWIPEQPDGDDHDYTVGPMNEFGYLYDFVSHVNDTVNINIDTNWSTKKYIYNNIVIPTGVTLTVSSDLLFYNGAKISMKGGILHINGGHLYNATIDVDHFSNSSIKISNGGLIKTAESTMIDIPLGSTLTISSGTIE